MIVAALQTRLPSTSDDIKEVVLGYVDTGYTQQPTKSDLYIKSSGCYMSAFSVERSAAHKYTNM